MQDRAINLADGRRLAVALFGDEQGAPLIYFHGTPGSRLGFCDDDELANAPGIRLITVDRPGYGGSDPKPGRSLLDWADDVKALADELDLPRFAVAGESGGGPYALGCACAMPDRVTVACLLASPSPADFRGATRGMALGNRIAVLYGHRLSWLARRLITVQSAAFLKKPEQFVKAVARQVGPIDGAVMISGEGRAAMIREVSEAYRQGGYAHFEDSQLVMSKRPWGFGLADVRVPVHVWFGDQDRLVSGAMTERLLAELPDATAHPHIGKGHLLSGFPDVADEVASVVRAAERDGGC